MLLSEIIDQMSGTKRQKFCGLKPHACETKFLVRQTTQEFLFAAYEESNGQSGVRVSTCAERHRETWAPLNTCLCAHFYIHSI